ncbi:hypothetical protein HHI36_005893 [Cryptolaemus montrouzieri]|uniref:procollagen-proline 3-dioxygenase n=1 Tax=Cryptolaemus montrouzieri TaxID=559131 RepID=A0ABD2NVZ4_9CUCU
MITFQMDYVYLYSHGSAAYEEKDWDATINNMEESLTNFLHTEEECRAQCEGSFDHGWLPDFIPSIANHFTYCLKCKSRCYSKLNSINGEKYEDLLPSHYNYLQFAYYKVGNLKEACRAVASFLLFFPNDESMLDNKEYYMKSPQVETNFFTPRSEAEKYVQRLTYEKKLLKFISKEFQSIAVSTEDVSKPRISQYKIVKTGAELKGSKRFLSEGLMTKKQCGAVVDIIKTFSMIGDGYDTSSPHTEMEKFEGLSIERVIFLVYLGLLNSRHLKMLLEVTEDAREKVKKYFNLDEPLFFTYTHMVCRSPFKGTPRNRTDLSHEIHADNCNIYPDGKCEKLPPSYTWRDYSAIIYLNSDFKGGEFFFSSNMSLSSIQSSVSPTCGRMLAFSSGRENLHGVKAVQKGSRCALGLWFTFDPQYEEKNRHLAYNLLEKDQSLSIY